MAGGEWPGGQVAGWLDQVKIRLNLTVLVKVIPDCSVQYKAFVMRILTHLYDKSC